MYKLTTFYFENDFKRNIQRRIYTTVETGLTWEQAKAKRNKDRTLQIVKQA